MGLKEDFLTASQQVGQFTKRPSNDELLSLYAFFKQATDGDVKGSRPGMLDNKGRKKFDAWSAKKGLTAERAMSDYLALVRDLKGRYA
jgi:diazepam-binding inhibitor (GABA receptor modulating acyl-CoA-binding protein)